MQDARLKWSLAVEHSISVLRWSMCLNQYTGLILKGTRGD
jgi:hypothetical protein